MSNILRRAAFVGILGIGGVVGLGASEAQSCDRPLGGPIGAGYPYGGYAGGFEARGYPGPGYDYGYGAGYGRTDVALQRGYRPMPVAAPFLSEPPLPPPVGYLPASYREVNRTSCTSVREVERTYPAPMPYGPTWPW